MLTRLANKLLDGGQADALAFVKSKLYDGQLPTASVIKTDLEYVSNIWPKTCFDPWEEIRGHHFYSRLVQKKALTEGAKLAERLNDGAATSQTYQDILAALRAAGDAQLARTKYHANPDGTLSEQMNRSTGFMQSANDLTWSYASFLTALAQRSP